jgi:hypothetical protein
MWCRLSVGSWMVIQQRRTEIEEEAFLQTLILCEEERRRWYPATMWTGDYRWFRSENVVALERYRTTEEINRIRVNILRRRPRLTK